jgi:hypothetical protein
MELRQRLTRIGKIGAGYEEYLSLNALVTDLQKDFAETVHTSDGCLRHITMVGALKRTSNGEDYLHHHDALDLATFITTAIRMGLPLSKEPEVDVVNLLYGRDFLKEVGPLEVVLFCHLYFNKDDAGLGLSERYTRAQSPLAHEENIWINRLETGGAKIVMARQDPEGSPNISGENFYNLVPRKPFLRLPNDPPQDAYSWHAEKAYWDLVRGHVNPEHPIVQGLNCQP